MKFSIEIKYFHPELKIGLENIKDAWLLTDLKNPIELKTIIHPGNSYYRFPKSGRELVIVHLNRDWLKRDR